MSISIKPSMKDFYLMVSGQIITILGSTLLRFALSLYVLDITGRADIFAGLYAVNEYSVFASSSWRCDSVIVSIAVM